MTVTRTRRALSTRGQTSPASLRAAGAASRQQDSCPDSGTHPASEAAAGAYYAPKGATDPTAAKASRRRSGPEDGTSTPPPASPPSRPGTATYRSPRPTKRSNSRSWCSFISRSRRMRSFGKASRTSTSNTEGCTGSPCMPSCSQTEKEMFGPAQGKPESILSENKRVLAGGDSKRTMPLDPDAGQAGRIAGPVSRSAVSRSRGRSGCGAKRHRAPGPCPAIAWSIIAQS